MFEYPLYTNTVNNENIWFHGNYVEDEGPKPPPPSNLLVALMGRIEPPKEAE